MDKRLDWSENLQNACAERRFVLEHRHTEFLFLPGTGVTPPAAPELPGRSNGGGGIPMAALCVECDAELNLTGRVRIGRRITCPSCGVQLEVISTYPLEVDIAYDDGEEWDDMDGYSLDDELEDEDADDIGRLEGRNRFELDDDLDADLEEELAEELDDELDDAGKR
jgi:alpha-aminoadipate carrier protein LysW